MYHLGALNGKFYPVESDQLSQVALVTRAKLAGELSSCTAMLP